MISDYPNHMTLQSEDDFYGRDYSEETPQYAYRHEFRDGSAIELIDMEDPTVTVPHKRFKHEWQAETAKEWIMENTLDTQESINYLKSITNEN